jgi:hypothetical protein
MSSLKKICGIISLVILLNPQSFTQSFSWDWGRSITGTGWVFSSLKHVDRNNNYYILCQYYDTIHFPDTTFSHTSFPPGYQALAIYNNDGKFMKAFDFYSEGNWSYINVTGIETDNQDNLYVSGSFYVSGYLFDTLLTASQQKSSELYVVKVNSLNKRKWLKTISGRGSDDVMGFNLTTDNNLALLGFHHTYGQGSDTVSFLGGLPVLLNYHLLYLIKFDTSGNIIWQRNVQALYYYWKIQGGLLEPGWNGNIYFSGSSTTDISIDGDTLMLLTNKHTSGCDFIIGYDLSGNRILAEMYDFSVGYFNVENNNDIITANQLYRTLYLKNDTIRPADSAYPPVFWGRIDTAMNLVWGYKFESQNKINTPNWIRFSRYGDSLIVTIVFAGDQQIGDTVFHAGSMTRKSIIAYYLTDGQLTDILLQDGTANVVADYSLPDNCGNIVSAGFYSDRFYIGDSVFYGGGNDAGYLSKIHRRNFNIDLGPDRDIEFDDTLVLSPGTGYDEYYWSNGSHEPTVTITGAKAGKGMHPFWVDVNDHGCWSSDTVRILIFAPGITEKKSDFFEIYPNPATNRIAIKNLPVSEKIHIDVFSSTGIRVGQFDFVSAPNEQFISVETLSPGLYLLKIQTKSFIESKKLLVIK